MIGPLKQPTGLSLEGLWTQEALAQRIKSKTAPAFAKHAMIGLQGQN